MATTTNISSRPNLEQSGLGLPTPTTTIKIDPQAKIFAASPLMKKVNALSQAVALYVTDGDHLKDYHKEVIMNILAKLPEHYTATREQADAVAELNKIHADIGIRGSNLAALTAENIVEEDPIIEAEIANLRKKMPEFATLRSDKFLKSNLRFFNKFMTT